MPNLRWLLAYVGLEWLRREQHPMGPAESQISLDHEAGTRPDPMPLRRPRMQLPVALSQVLGADCSSCRGIGCDMCAHTGLN